MSRFYNSNRKRNRYEPGSNQPFKLSRSKLELFLNCPRCFYNDRRLGIGQPPGYPFALNSAVDALLKKEFDLYRKAGQPHPLMTRHGIEGIPFAHDRIDEWRDALHAGIQFHDAATNLIITGAVDDLWVNPKGELIIVDYKATSKTEPLGIEADWQIGYKRQMALYAWLFKKNNFLVADIGYFVYCNGLVNRDRFDQKLEFDIAVIPYRIDDSWVDKVIRDAHLCLNSPNPPAHSEDCDFCAYNRALSGNPS